MESVPSTIALYPTCCIPVLCGLSVNSSVFFSAWLLSAIFVCQLGVVADGLEL